MSRGSFFIAAVSSFPAAQLPLSKQRRPPKNDPVTPKSGLSDRTTRTLNPAKHKEDSRGGAEYRSLEDTRAPIARWRSTITAGLTAVSEIVPRTRPSWLSQLT